MKKCALVEREIIFISVNNEIKNFHMVGIRTTTSGEFVEY